MTITAQQARELRPKGYLSTELLYFKIKQAAEAGFDYMWSDLTLEQIAELKSNNFIIEEDRFKTKYIIKWDR